VSPSPRPSSGSFDVTEDDKGREAWFTLTLTHGLIESAQRIANLVKIVRAWKTTEISYGGEQLDKHAIDDLLVVDGFRLHYERLCDDELGHGYGSERDRHPGILPFEMNRTQDYERDHERRRSRRRQQPSHRQPSLRRGLPGLYKNRTPRHIEFGNRLERVLHAPEIRDAGLALQTVGHVVSCGFHFRRRQLVVDEFCKPVFQMGHFNHLPMMFATG